MPNELKKPFKGLRGRRGSCWEERNRKVFPRRGIKPPGKSVIFTYLASLTFECLRPSLLHMPCNEKNVCQVLDLRHGISVSSLHSTTRLRIFFLEKQLATYCLIDLSLETLKNRMSLSISFYDDLMAHNYCVMITFYFVVCQSETNFIRVKKLRKT